MNLRPRRYDLIVFDWDGTLYDSTALITRCIQAACKDLGVAVPNDRDASFVIGLGLIDAMRQAAPGLPEERYPEMARRYRHHYFNDLHEITLFEGVPALLDALKARQHRLAVATGKSRQGLDEALHLSGLRSRFDASRTADETSSKPHPQMLLELMHELAVKPERTLMIGDTTHDLQLARNAGTHAVAVTYGAHPREELLGHNTQHVAHSVAELHRWLLDQA